jgi:hypothetical protein
MCAGMPVQHGDIVFKDLRLQTIGTGRYWHWHTRMVPHFQMIVASVARYYKQAALNTVPSIEHAGEAMAFCFLHLHTFTYIYLLLILL